MTDAEPIFVPPPEHIRKIHRQVDLIKRLSDRVVGIGPFGIGLDGVLAWIPGAGLVYGLGAGALLLVHGFRAKASPGTLARMFAYLAIDNATDTVPVIGWAIDTVFPGHLMAANALQKDMVAKHGPLEPPNLKLAGKGTVVPGRRSRLGWVIGGIIVAGVMVLAFILAGGALVRAVTELWQTVARR